MAAKAVAPAKAGAAATSPALAAAKSSASIKRARQQADSQAAAATAEGCRNIFLDVVLRQFREYSKYCRVAAVPMYEHGQEYYGAFLGFCRLVPQ